MKKAILTFICVALAVHFSFGQEMPPGYMAIIKNALTSYRAKDYKASALAYSDAFNKFGWAGFTNDHYKAACSWILAGYPDSAFSNLEYIAKNENFSNYAYASTDKNMISLHKDKRWQPFLDMLKANEERIEAKLNKPLMNELDSMYLVDVKERNLASRLKTKNESASAIDSMMKIITISDSLNFLRTRELFKKYGFPNYDLVGHDGTFHFWLLVRHQDKHPTFQDSVLKAMKPEVDKKQAPGSDYALLLDRLKVSQGELQIYGTQVKLNSTKTSYEPEPIIEPAKLNERRKSLGLSTIEDYIQMMNKRSLGITDKKQPPSEK